MKKVKGKELEYYCFDIRKIKFNRKKDKKENDENYLKAVSKFFKKNFPLPNNYNYAAYKLRANNKTLKFLENKLSPGVYLSFSPMEDNNIEDFKICALNKNKKELIEKRRKK